MRRRGAVAGLSTKAVHVGEGDAATGTVTMPIHQTTTYLYPELADGSPSKLIYSRYDNPTLQAVEAKLAALENADQALVFSSGMAATAAVCTTFLRPGDTVAVQRGVYGGTTAYMEDHLAPMGVNVVLFDLDHPTFAEGTKVVWVEAVSNPLLRIADVATLAKAAHDAGARLVVDATFATPALLRPLEHGADVVMHSASKYLGGHSDLLGGVLAYPSDLHDGLWRTRRNLGATMDPHQAWLLGRGIKTLALRMDRQGANAVALAEVAAQHPAVRAVHHPGQPSHPSHPLAHTLAGPVAMMTVDVESVEAAVAFRRAVQIFRPAASLGSVESLVCLPVETSHAYADPAARAAQGITDGLVRISVGIEDLEDLEADLVHALDAAREAQEGHGG